MKCLSTLSAIAAATIAVTALGADLPNFDAVATAPRVSVSARSAAIALSGSSPARMQWDDRFGVPSFVWPQAKTTSTVAAVHVAQSPEAAARSFVSDYAPLYGLASADINDAYVADVHDTGAGAVVVKLRQRIGGIDVFREEMNVVLNHERDLVALAGHISPLPRASRLMATSAQGGSFFVTPAAAIAIAASDDGVDANNSQLRGDDKGGYQLYTSTSGNVRVKRVYFHLPDRFEPAYYVERGAYSYVISSVNGAILFRNNLIADQSAPASFAYRVWAGSDGDHLPFSGPQGYDGTPSPSGVADGYQPTFVLPNLVTLTHGSISTGDPWLPATATETTGNNADAYADIFAPDGFSTGDMRARITGPASFDRTYDIRQSPASDDQRMAAVTQLFYDVNFFHDWYYDAGFNERAGNAQASNYGRGGIENDPILAEGDDYSGRNNANMLTPADGVSPRMQMFLWDGAGNRTLNVSAPSSIAAAYITGTGVFGPQSFDVTGPVASTSPVDGCTAITTNLTGKIAFIDRGGSSTCFFVTKVANARAAGAIGVIIGNVATSVSPDSVATMGCPTTGCPADQLSYPPAFNVALTDANAFRANLANGIRVTMHRDAAVDRDGTIDNQIVAHEWMHYMTNRLVGNGNGLTSNQARGMGEGWSDFNAMLMSVRPDDTRFASNSSFNGAYGVAVYATTGGTNGPIVNNSVYYGIRRVPYSTDMTKDPLSLRHIMNGVPILNAPLRYGADGLNNAEVHSTGEVWATMLWEAYATMLRDTLGSSPRLTFGEAQKRMKEYLVAALKITPPTPTFTEARDALLAAAFARDKVDYRNFWAAFSKRGAGLVATSAERYSADNSGAVEDFNGGGGMTVASVSVEDSASSCLRDGILDAGENGSLRVTLRNIGATRLEATTLRVTSSDSSVSFANGGTVSVPASDPGQTVSAVVDASIAAGSASVLKPDLTLTVSDPQITTATGMSSVYLARLNTIDQPKESSTDDVEAANPAWTMAATGVARWTRLEVSPREHRWYAPEPGAASDQSLISPPLVVSATADFSFSFRHRFAFDFGDGAVIDGGVIEISTDDGKTWNDIGSRIDPSTAHYGPSAILGANGSAIEGRQAFEALSPGFNSSYPSKSPFVSTVVRLGTTYAGMRVRIRFRFVTGIEHAIGARNGWEIDDIAFTNIDNLPFATVVADRGGCGVSSTTTALSASTTTAPPAQPITLSATVASSAAPSGTVDFFDNGNIIATARLDNGVARATARLPLGTHLITATFNGGKYFTASTSSAVMVQSGASGGRRRAVH